VGDTKRLWNTLHAVLRETRIDDAGAHTADEFAAFFRDKVDSVRVSSASTTLYEVPYRMTPTFERFAPVTAEEVERLIGNAPCKTCQLDPVPIWLVKEMRALISPFLSLLFNKSLTSGCFPTQFKRAVVRPLLKKEGLDAIQSKNYRSVSNLTFFSKLLERTVLMFLDDGNMLPATQSALGISSVP